jgi:proprotein convertase subtilisin/kexin type 5
MICGGCGNNRKEITENCICLDGYYDDGGLDCLKCDSKCKTCEKNKCLECGANRLAAPDCLCKDGYYDNNTLDCQACISKCKSGYLECPNKCETCDAYDNCLKCSGKNRMSDPPGCTCSVGTFDDGVSKDCQVCGSKCETCVGLATTCTKCSGTLRILTPDCDCKDGYFEGNGEC